MAKIIYVSCIFSLWIRDAASDDKWVWNGSERSAKLAKGAGGRYGVFEEPVGIPGDPYNPLILPQASNLPSFVRPTPDGHTLDRPYDARPRPPSGLGAFYNGANFNRPGAIGSDRLPLPGGLDRPYDRPNNGFINNHNKYPNRPNPSFHPPLSTTKPGFVDHEDADPTKFDQCKCTHSFNCKSPGIVFGSCDVGKKYCCEKRIHHSNGIPIAVDGPIPEVLAGPGGPVDYLRHQGGAYPVRGNFAAGLIEPRRP